MEARILVVLSHALLAGGLVLLFKHAIGRPVEAVAQFCERQRAVSRLGCDLAVFFKSICSREVAVLLLAAVHDGVPSLRGGRPHFHRFLKSRVLIEAIHHSRVLCRRLQGLLGHLSRGCDAILVDESWRIAVLLTIRVELVLLLFV